MNLRVLRGFTRPYRVNLAFCVSLMLLETAAALAVPWLGEQLASGVLSSSASAHVPHIVGLAGPFRIPGVAHVCQRHVLSRTAVHSGRSAHSHLRPLTGLAAQHFL